MDINLFVNSVLCILIGFLFSKKNNHFSKEFKILFFILGGISFISSFTFMPNNTTLNRY